MVNRKLTQEEIDMWNKSISTREKIIEKINYQIQLLEIKLDNQDKFEYNFNETMLKNKQEFEDLLKTDIQNPYDEYKHIYAKFILDNWEKHLLSCSYNFMNDFRAIKAQIIKYKDDIKEHEEVIKIGKEQIENGVKVKKVNK